MNGTRGGGARTNRCKLCGAEGLYSKRSRLCPTCWERVNGTSRNHESREEAQ